MLGKTGLGPHPLQQQMGFVALITAKNGGQGPGHVQGSFKAQGKRGSLHTPEEQVLCELSSQACQNTRGSVHAAWLFHGGPGRVRLSGSSWQGQPEGCAAAGGMWAVSSG